MHAISADEEQPTASKINHAIPTVPKLSSVAIAITVGTNFPALCIFCKDDGRNNVITVQFHNDIYIWDGSKTCRLSSQERIAPAGHRIGGALDSCPS